MSTLNTLKLVVAKKPAKLPPVILRRNKLLARLWEQIELAKAVQNGTTFAPMCVRTMKDASTGVSSEITRPKRIRPWWWTNDNGKVCVSIKYGNKPIELAKGKSAVEVASPKDLVDIAQAHQARDLAAVIRYADILLPVHKVTGLVLSWLQVSRFVSWLHGELGERNMTRI